MSCIKPDGTLNASAVRLLRILAEPRTVEAISRAQSQPVFLVRSRLRELLDGGYVAAEGDRYSPTPKARAALGE